MKGDGELIGFGDGRAEVQVFERAKVVKGKVPFERGRDWGLGRLGLFARVEIILCGRSI